MGIITHSWDIFFFVTTVRLLDATSIRDSFNFQTPESSPLSELSPNDEKECNDAWYLIWNQFSTLLFPIFFKFNFNENRLKMTLDGSMLRERERIERRSCKLQLSSVNKLPRNGDILMAICLENFWLSLAALNSKLRWSPTESLPSLIIIHILQREFLTAA